MMPVGMMMPMPLPVRVGAAKNTCAGPSSSSSVLSKGLLPITTPLSFGVRPMALMSFALANSAVPCEDSTSYFLLMK